MNIFKKYKELKATNAFYENYKKLEEQGKIVHFNDEVLSCLNGKYWQGLPMYYFLTTEMSMGRCYDASCALGLAMGEGSYIVRGNLDSMKGAWSGNTGHGWVETDTHVYDTTWQILCKKEDYYKVFKPKNISRISYSKFKKDISSITDPEIRDKQWYENNPSTANILIFQVREIELRNLKSDKTSDEEKKFAQRVLNDLPNVSLRELNDKIDKELKEMFEEPDME